ncbi:MAG: dihydropyrimidinase [Bacteroidetes bacterium]|nr:dihydropyrimidinase [Bacteroidota bacterium]
MSLLIKNGTIVTSEKTFKGDILTAKGKISKIGSHLTLDNPIGRVIDASGYYIFPGGIDPHVHMHLPTPAGFSSDDFLSGSKAALLGGITTIIDFVTPKKGQSLIEALKERKKEATNSLIDHSFHVSPIEWYKNSEQEIKTCIKKEGINSFKIYMAYKDTIGLEDADILKVMKVVGKSGGLVTVHCELGDEIEILRNEFVKKGKTKPEYHPLSRPAKMEAEAVNKAIQLAKKAECPLYIVHVSTNEAIRYINQAQQKGQKVFAETCPQYLLLNNTKYKGDFSQTAPYVMSPPLREPIDNQALWQALSEGIIQTTGTDHCPFLMKQKEAGIHDFRKITNGAGGVEHRLALLFTYGVLTNKISINQFVNITSTQAAKIFGLYPQKGEIALQSDADLIIWDPNKENTISSKTHHQHCDTNIYEGLKTKGSAKYVIAKGRVVVQDNEWLSDKLKGSFLKRHTDGF